MEDSKNLSKAQAKARSFIDEHNVEKILGEMLNSLVHARDPQPIIFMVGARPLGAEKLVLAKKRREAWQRSQLSLECGTCKLTVSNTSRASALCFRVCAD